MPQQPIGNKSPDYARRIPEWQLVRHALEGEDRIKEEGTTYLPRPEGQDTGQYARYKERATFLGVADRTARGLVGLVFRVDPQTKIPAALAHMEVSATPDGDPLITLAHEIVREILSVGRYGLLVDMAQAPSLVGKARPYIAPYVAENIWLWDETFDPVAGERVLQRVVVKEEPVTEDEESTTYLRELYLDADTGVYLQQLWRKVEPEHQSRRDLSRRQADQQLSEDNGYEQVGEPFQPTKQGRPLTRIPFVFVNTYNLLPRPHKPPFYDLARVNIAHYRNSADYEQALHLIAQPTPWIAADWEQSQKPTHIGAATIWYLSKDAQAGMVEFTGKGMATLRQAMADKEDQMAILGSRIIQDQQSNIKVETMRMQTRAQTSVLTEGVNQAQLALEKALTLANEWAGGSGKIEYKLNRDFVETTLSAQELDSLVKGWQAGAFSRQTLHENLQRGEIVPVDRSADEEVSLIESDDPALMGQPAGAPAGGPAARGDAADDAEADDETADEE